MLSLESFGRVIKIRGRKPDGARYTNMVSFKPYFYIPPNESYSGDVYTTLDGKRVRKIICENVGQLVAKRTRHVKTYESDVRHIVKYMIDNFDEIAEEPIRVCFLDIETEDRDGFPDIGTADKMISSICCYDSFSKKYYVFLTSPENKERVYRKEYDLGDDIKVESKIIECETEKNMLMKFIDFVNTLDFDMVYAWNGDGFDYPYIFNRMTALNIDPKLMSPFDKMKNDNDLKKPSGRAFLDLLLAYKKLSTQKSESYSLDYISEVELGTKKVVHAEKIGDMWESDTQKFLKYNIKDVYLMVEIERHKGVTKYFDNIRRTTFCDWYDILYNPRVLDCYMLKCAHDLNIILPDRIYETCKDDPVEGAIVGIPTIGLSKNVAVGDVKSLYPSAIKTCNMSPETIISERIAKEQNIEYCKVDDVCFRLDKRGFIPRVIEKLWDLRQEYKRQMRECEYGSEEYHRLDTTQITAKVILNSIYGVMKFKSFRLYNRDTFKSVTYFGRKNNLYMQKVVKDTGHQLVLYDTDSVDFKLNKTDFEEMIEEANGVIDKINNGCSKWCIDNFGSDKYNCIEVEMEKIYGSLFTIMNEDGEEVKKRYAGLIIYDDGKDLRDNPSMLLMGLQGKRSDTPPIFKNLQKDILRDILIGKTDDAIDKIKTVRTKITRNEYRPEEIAIPMGMSKTIYEYDRPSAAIRGAMFANEFCGENIKCDKVRYVYVKEKKYKPEVPRTNVVSFMENFPKWMEVDTERMAERLIDKPYLNILYTLGYSIETLKGQKSIFDW